MVEWFSELELISGCERASSSRALLSEISTEHRTRPKNLIRQRSDSFKTFRAQAFPSYAILRWSLTRACDTFSEPL